MSRVLAVWVVLSGVCLASQEGKGASSALDRMKGLAGTWEGEGMTVTYKVTAGGSAVMETLGPGTEKEMITMYHVDGEDLVLTHYCMLGNQPRMKAPKDSKGDSIRFSFAGGGNLKAEKDMHMHSLVLTFQDKDHVKQEWTMFEGGKEKGVHAFSLTRKKE